jgi:hypothetical protein
VDVSVAVAVWLGDSVGVFVDEVVGLRHDVLVGVPDREPVDDEVAVLEAVDVVVAVVVLEKVGYAGGSTLVVTTGADALAVVAASPSPGKKECTNATPSMAAVHTGAPTSTPLSTEIVAPASCVIWQSSHQSSPRLYTSIRTMAAVHGSVSRSH